MVVATSRELRSVRNARVSAVAAVGAILVVAIAFGFLPFAVVVLLNGALALAVLVALIAGMLRLVRGRA